MARNYVSIGKEIALTGFFSEYLPPCFKLNEKVLNYPPASECDLVRPLSFTMGTGKRVEINFISHKRRGRKISKTSDYQ